MATSLVLRADKSPPADPPQPGELSAEEMDSNLRNLRATADSALQRSEATVVDGTKLELSLDDQLVIKNSDPTGPRFMLTSLANLVNHLSDWLGDGPANTEPAAPQAGDWNTVPGDGQIAVVIDVVPSDNGSALTELQYRLNAGVPAAFSGVVPATYYITSGVNNGVPVNVQWRALNAIGAGPWSDVKEETPVGPGVPAAPTIGMWSLAPLNGALRVDIDALPSDNGSAITALQYRLDAGSPVSFAGTGTGVRDIDGLTNGVPVNVQWRAVNAVGAGPWSDTKAGTPAVPGGLVAVQAARYDEWFTTTTLNLPAPSAAGNTVIVGVVIAATDKSVVSVVGSDSVSFGAPIHTYDSTNAKFAFYRRANAPALSSVTLTLSDLAPANIFAAEFSGLGPTPVLDDSDGGEYDTDVYVRNMAINPSVAPAAVVALNGLNAGTSGVPTVNSPFQILYGEYDHDAYGVVESPGPQNVTITLDNPGAAQRGEWATIVMRASA